MKILIATPLYPPDIGGPATYTKLLEDTLPERGVEVAVVSFGDSRHLPKGLSHLHYFFRVSKALRGCELILAQDPISVGLPSMIAAKLFRKKFVIRMPGDYAWEQSVQRFGVTDTIDDFQSKKYGVRVTILRKLQVFVSKRADSIITPSDYFRRIVVGWGIDENRVTTIYNGVDFTEQPQHMEKRERLTMVTAGRLVSWKGFDEILEILTQLPDWDLVIIGDGPERTSLEKKSVLLEVSHRVTFTGSLPRKEVLGWCKISDAFLLNTYFESFSFQIAEAMMCGASIITTNTGSIPELISNGKEGILLKPGDVTGFVEAIKSVTSDPEVWQERNAQAQEKAQKFSVTNTVEGVVHLIQKCTT